jgi:hypothetical protein
VGLPAASAAAVVKIEWIESNSAQAAT